MTIHLAKARLSFAPSWNPQHDLLNRIHAEMVSQERPRLLRGLESAFQVITGHRLVNRRGLELFEYVLKRGVVAGGSDFANYLEGEIVDHIFRNTGIFTSPTSVFIALYTADPGESGSNTNEVANANGYAREEVSAWSGSGGASSTDNTNDIDFGTASGGNWGTITHTAVTDTATHGSGNHYFNGALVSSKTVNDGDSFVFPAGDFDVALD